MLFSLYTLKVLIERKSIYKQGFSIAATEAKRCWKIGLGEKIQVVEK